MAETSSAAAQLLQPKIKALILDFDSTISTPTFLHRLQTWCVADNLKLFQAMSEAEILANFGGTGRIAALKALLGALEAAGVRLHIVSIGMKAAIVPHLKTAGLVSHFPEELIWGQDCHELRSLGFVKGRLIAQLMSVAGWQHSDVLFVDDSKEHIDKAQPVCRTLLVESKATVGGMGPYEFAAIRKAAGLAEE